MRLIHYLTERHSRGSKEIKLYAKTYEEAYGESMDIIRDVFHYENIDLEIEVKGNNGDIDFYDKDMTLLAKMKKKNDKYVIYTITE